ncbi:MAG: fibronectin type III domain-containing protein [Planctomycetaceae bacterium]|nr:fibronectin type III domain-containing protein [Planctomycetaceae bacterium]
MSFEILENRELLSANTIVQNVQNIQNIQDVQDVLNFQNEVLFSSESAGSLVAATVSGSGVLTIEGTDNDDWVQVREISNGSYEIYVSASYGDFFTQLDTTTYAGVTSIVFNGYDGDDTFKAWYNDVYVTVACTINGGNGNDDLMGGAGSNTFNGGNGNDLLIGGTGTNVFYNTGTGSSAFLWRSKIVNGDDWASDSSIDSAASGKDDANLTFSDTGMIDIELQSWTDKDFFGVVDVIHYVYNLLGNYRFFCSESHVPVDMLIATHGELGSDILGTNGGNTITLDSVYTSSKFVIIHEFAHNWHHSSYYQQLVSISWNGNSKKSGSQNGDFARDYGKTYPFEDWTTTFEVVLAGDFVPQNATDKWFQKEAIVRNFLNDIGDFKFWGKSEIIVTSASVPVGLQSKVLSLQKAVFYAGQNTVIKFADSLKNQTIYLENYELLRLQQKGLVIDGTEQNISINIGLNGFYITANGEITFRNLTLTGGTGDRAGLVYGNLSLINVVVTGNVNTETTFNIQASGSLLVMNSTLAGNSNSKGIVLTSGTVEITNSLIVGNKGNPLNLQAKSTTVNNSHIVGNTGVIAVYSNLTVNNSIIAYNNSDGNNFLMNTGGKVKVNASLIRYQSSVTNITVGSDSRYSADATNKIDPKFETYSIYSTWSAGLWETWDLHLIENESPALGKGNIALVPVGVTKDKEGNSRHNRGAVDMGAYQHSYVVGDLPSEFGSTVSASGVTTNAVTITWTKPNKSFSVTGNQYTVWLKTGNEWTEQETTTKTTVTLTGLNAETDYEYMVTATINKIPEVILVSDKFKTRQAGAGANIPVGAVTEVKTTVASKVQVGTSKVDAVKITWKAPANYTGGYIVAIIGVDSGTNTPVTGATPIEITINPDAKTETYIRHSLLTTLTRYQVIVRADKTYAVASTPTYFNYGNTKDPEPTPIAASSGASTSLKIATPKKSSNSNVITSTSAKVYWKDSETTFPTTLVPIQYKVLVYDANKALIEYAYVAAGTQEYSINATLTPKSKYTVEIYAVAAAGKTNEKMSSKLSISVTTNDYPASIVKMDSKKITIVSAGGLTMTEPKNIPSGTVLNHYVEYTDVVNAKGKPDWNSAVVEQITNKSQPFDLGTQLNPNTQYFVRIITVNSSTLAAATQVVYGKETKFKTATIPLATFTKSGFALDNSSNYGVKFGIQSPSQNDTKNLLPTSPTISFQYKLYVADDKAKIDKSTGILIGAKELRDITVTLVNDPRKPFFVSDVVSLSEIASAFDDLTQLKSIQFQLVVTYTDSELGGVFAALPTKALKFSLPKWS